MIGEVNHDWPAERREDAEAALRFLAMAAQRAYAGTLVVPGIPVVLAGATVEMLSRAYGEAVVTASQHWGAELLTIPGDYAHDTAQVVATITDALADLTKPETVIESCAEVLRVLVCGAIIAAKDDCKDDDSVLIAVRRAPHFLVMPHFETDSVFVAGRMRVSVARKAEPLRSYLLGGNMQLDYRLPDARMFAGAGRLRFLDQRSPGHLVHEELIKVTA